MTFKPRIQQILNEIQADTRRGASDLARLGLDALSALTDEPQIGDSFAEPLAIQSNRLVKKIVALRPAMGAIGHAAALAVGRADRLADEGKPYAEALELAVAEQKNNLRSAGPDIARAVREKIGTGGIITTCSTSATVKEVVLSLGPDTLRVGVGHPQNDGVAAANCFNDLGLSVELFPDGALPAAVQGAKAVIVGADMVLGNGDVVNRTSTLALAIFAAHFSVPFLVVCDRTKFTGKKTVRDETCPNFEESLSGTTRDIKRIAPLFDITPRSLVTEIISDKIRFEIEWPPSH